MAEINYLDLDLLIERSGQGYRARILNSPAGQAAADFALPFSELELENFLLRVGRTQRGVRRVEAPETEAAKVLGGRLFNAVFGGEVKGCLRSSLDEVSRQGAGLRLRLRLADVPELLDLPWEYLYNPTLNRFLALSTETPLVRYLDMPEHIHPLAVKPPLRVLVMISSPSDYPPLDVEREWAKLTEALKDLTQRGLVSLERLEQATLSALQRRLRQGEYHVFHFVGHGGFDQQAQDGVLLLESEEKRGRPVSGGDLGTLLHDERTLRLAILNACEGARASRADPFAGTAQSLVQQGIPAVIGMQFEISDEAAITFSHEFYAAVADGYPVDAALAEARKAIFAQGNALEWGTPVLYLRAPDGRIFDVERVSEEERGQVQAAALFREAQTATAGENWAVAVEKSKAVLALDPAHAEAATILSQAQQQQKLANLYAMGQRHYEAGRWREALDYFRQVKVAGGSFKDVDALVATAQDALAKREAAPAPPAPPVRPPAVAQPPSKPSGIPLAWIGGGVGVLALLVCVGLAVALALRGGLGPTPPPTTPPQTSTPTSTSVMTPTPTRAPTMTPTRAPTMSSTPTRTPTTPSSPTDNISNFQVRSVSDNEVQFTVDYSYNTDHGDSIYLGAYALQGGQRLGWFGFSPERVSRGNGHATIRLVFGYHNPPASVTTDQVEVVLYLSSSTFYSKKFDYNKTWHVTTPMPTPTRTPTTGPAIVSGRVVDSSGAPIDQIGIAIIQGSDRIDVYSSADGTFSKSVPRGGRWNVQIVGINCKSRVMDSNCNMSGYFELVYNANVDVPQTDPLNLVFQKATTVISGVVVDKNGNPKAGVRVKALRGDGGFSWVNSSASGQFALPAADGTWDVYTVSFNPPSEGPHIQVSVSPGVRPASVRLSAP